MPEAPLRLSIRSLQGMGQGLSSSQGAHVGEVLEAVL